jgi:hypothetical protein
VDIYDAQTNIWSTTTLSQAVTDAAGTSVGQIAIVGGGLDSSAYPTNVVTIMTFSLDECTIGNGGCDQEGPVTATCSDTNLTAPGGIVCTCSNSSYTPQSESVCQCK